MAVDNYLLKSRPMFRFSRLALVILFCLTFQFAVSAQTASPEATEKVVGSVEPAASPTPADLRNLIHFGDYIDVDVVGSAEFDWRGTLTPEGFLDGLDFIEEPVYALCRSEEQVAAAVAAAYSKLLKEPVVTVRILDRAGRAVSFLYGAVQFPQRLLIQREVRLSEILVLAGGLDERASGEIEIMRFANLNCVAGLGDGSTETVRKAETQTRTISVRDVIKGTPDSNPVVLNGDIITVQQSDPVYVIGGVANPKQVNARNKLSVSRAIASAGGLTKGANPKNVVIYRRGPSEVQRIEVDLDSVQAGASEDVILERYDIVEVSQKGNDSRRMAPVVRVYSDFVKSSVMPLRIIE
jgi:protein involved in polysaccharide export with SLBB domain